MRFFIVVLAVTVSFGPALAFFDDPLGSARRISNFRGNDVYRSIQCEVGQFAKLARKEKLRMKAGLRAAYGYEGTTNVSRTLSFSAGLQIAFLKALSGPNISYSIEDVENDTISFEDSVGIETANTGGCRSNRPPVNVLSCLTDQSDALLTGHAKCIKSITAHGVFDVNAKIIVWYVNVGPGFKYDVKRTFKVTVEAPQKEEKGG